MNTETRVSHSARAIMAICCFLIEIPAEERIPLFQNSWYWFENPDTGKEERLNL
jgi:hypothetical protein